MTTPIGAKIGWNIPPKNSAAPTNSATSGGQMESDET